MTYSRMLILIFSFSFLGLSYAETTTVVLQQGLNGYSGVQDTWVGFKGDVDSNYVNDTSIKVSSYC